MPHFPKPFWRSNPAGWCVEIGGKQKGLGTDWPKALAEYAQLLARDTAGLAESSGTERAPTGCPQNVPKVSLADAVDSFLADCAARLRPGTVQWYRERLGWMAAAVGRDTPLESLTASAVSRWAMDPKKDWSPAYRHGLLTAAGRLTSWAARHEVVPRDNLAGKISKPSPVPRSRILSEADYRKLLGIYPAGDTFLDLLTLCWETGCRPQEALRFEVCHYQAAARRLSLPSRQAKGGVRARHVYLSDAAEGVVSRLVAGKGAGVLLLNEDGVPWKRHAVACRFGRAAGVLGVKYRLYDLRHSFAHRMLAAGVPAASVAQLMGHVDTQMVLRVYGHLEAADEFLRSELRRGKAG